MNSPGLGATTGASRWLETISSKVGNLLLFAVFGDAEIFFGQGREDDCPLLSVTTTGTCTRTDWVRNSSLPSSLAERWETAVGGRFGNGGIDAVGRRRNRVAGSSAVGLRHGGSGKEKKQRAGCENFAVREWTCGLRRIELRIVTRNEAKRLREWKSVLQNEDHFREPGTRLDGCTSRNLQIARFRPAVCLLAPTGVY